MLRVENLSFSYDKIQAIRNVSFELQKGEIMAIVGANGAGKSSLMKCIAGLLKPQCGEVYLNDKKMESAAYRVVESGVSLVPEGRWIFPNLTVEENLLLGGYTSRNRAAGVERSFAMFPRLEERRRQRAGTMSGGEQQMLAMGRALMSNASMLMLDEPSMGLSPLLVQEIFDIIRDIHKEGMTILLVEQNAQMALSVADRAYVLETGHVVMDGTGAELLTNERVRNAYLGG